MKIAGSQTLGRLRAGILGTEEQAVSKVHGYQDDSCLQITAVVTHDGKLAADSLRSVVDALAPKLAELAQLVSSQRSHGGDSQRTWGRQTLGANIL